MSAIEVPFDLSEAKLVAPRVREGTVVKGSVITRLSTVGPRLATVVAPAGYGKTTLLVRWAEADPRPFAWVVLDARDGDAVRLLRYVAAALHRVFPIGPEVFDALSGTGRSIWAERVPRVGAAIAATERPLVLVFDDLHFIANPACLDVVAELVQYVPAGSQIAIASREEPALPLARWRANGHLHEVGVAELRLDEQEAALLLGAEGVELDEGGLADLTAQTEGWPAGLYLAALSMQMGADGSTGGQGFNGGDVFVSEYFRHELLSRLPAADATFLKHTSVLERMSGELCDAVLQTSGSHEKLEKLERANSFVVRLDRTREWYRYHHLFGQLLRQELERSEPALAAGLNRRAAAWCIAHGLPEEAITYAQAAGDADTVAGLVDALALSVYFDGRQHTVEKWLAWFGEDDLRYYPALAVYGAWIYVLTGNAADAERWLNLAEGATSRIPISDGSIAVEPWIATLRAYMMPDGVEQAVTDADRALDLLPPTSGWFPVALLGRGLARALFGDIDRAEEDLHAAVDRGMPVGSVQTVFVAQAQLSLLAAQRGAWHEAAEFAAAAMELVESVGLGAYAGSALVHVASARVALHEGRHEDARAALTSAHLLRPLLDHGLPWLTIEVGLELTRAHLALAEPGPARTILAETERVLERRPEMGSLVVDAQELHERAAATSGTSGAWAMSLTGAELRLLPYLATHLTFLEIASRLFITRNTVKSEAISIYRKLGAASRSEAIEQAVDVGLLESSRFMPLIDG